MLPFLILSCLVDICVCRGNSTIFVGEPQQVIHRSTEKVNHTLRSLYTRSIIEMKLQLNRQKELQCACRMCHFLTGWNGFSAIFRPSSDRSPLTIREYRYDLVLFFRFMLRQRGLAPADQAIRPDRYQPGRRCFPAFDQADRFLCLPDLAQPERHCGPSTRARKIAALGPFSAI